jgi:T-complex protein 1 subunit delta
MTHSSIQILIQSIIYHYIVHLVWLQDIKVLCQLGGTVEDTELVEGLVFTQKAAGTNGPRKVEKAKIGLIQFCISPPKTDVSLS